MYAFMENLFLNNFPGIFQLMAITNMLAEIVGSSFTSRGRSERIMQLNIFAMLRS